MCWDKLITGVISSLHVKIHLIFIAIPEIWIIIILILQVKKTDVQEDYKSLASGHIAIGAKIQTQEVWVQKRLLYTTFPGRPLVKFAIFTHQ